MAHYQTIAPLEGITGKLNKKGKTVFRQKFARDSNGAVIRPMRKEVYVIQNPRDWKKKPAMVLRKNMRMCLNEAHPRVFEENLLTSIDSESVNSGCSVYLARA